MGKKSSLFVGRRPSDLITVSYTLSYARVTFAKLRGVWKMPSRNYGLEDSVTENKVILPHVGYKKKLAGRFKVQI